MSLKTIFSDSGAVYNPVSASSWNVLNGTSLTYSAVITFVLPDAPGADEVQIPVLITKIGENNMIVSLQLSQLSYADVIINTDAYFAYKSSTPLPAGLFNPDKSIQIGISSGAVFGGEEDLVRPCPFSWYIDTEGYIYYCQAYQAGTNSTNVWNVGWDSRGYHYHPSCSTTGACNVRTAITDGTILYTNSTFLVSLL